MSYAILFDGLDDYVHVPHNPVLEPPLPLTLEAWVRAEMPIPHDGKILWKCTGYSIGIAPNGYIYVSYKDETDTWRANRSGIPLPPGELVQIIATMEADGPNTKIDIDFNAVLNSSDSLPGNPKYFTPPEPVRIGRGFIDIETEWYKGIVELVRIYNKKLTQTEKLQNYNTPWAPVEDGLILWLPFNEGEGSVAYDFSGYGNNGTVIGAQWVESLIPTPHPVSEPPISILAMLGGALMLIPIFIKKGRG